MLRIPCPHCGLRDQTEFTYGGDASMERPQEPLATDDPTWDRYLYLRENPMGEHFEYWHHTRGCRLWLKVTRDTTTSEILEVKPARDRRRAT